MNGRNADISNRKWKNFRKSSIKTRTEDKIQQFPNKSNANT